MSEIRFDGRVGPYVPPVDPPAAVAELLHTDATAVDPSRFDILRHALWNLNIEHGNTIIRTSGSPVVVYAHDFNPVVLDEWGNYVYFGPWLQYLVAASSPAVKWILENRHDSPGIEPGSMFMTNDPWIGATHQSDLTVLAPVFWEGKIFSWVGSSLHHQDLGGTAPGGFNPVAEDVFWESGVIPPVRIVENGVIRKDLEEEYTRRSRMPDLVAVDLRAQIAGCRVAVARMTELLERYGGATLKGSMRKVQDDSEQAFVKRIETVPDGEWRSEAFLEMAAPGDRKLHRNTIVLRKKDGKLTFSNEGTDPQIGALSCTLAGWTGGLAAMINSQLMFDQLFAVGGALRRIEFKAEPGTLSSALHPSALSLAVLTIDQCIALAASAISKMLSCSSDPELREEIQSSMGSATFPIAAIAGADASGNPFATLLMEPVATGMAAWSWRDGLDMSGWPWDPQVTMPNVEETEAFYPLLQLWRRIVPDTGGAGRYRGGNSGEAAIVPYGVDQVTHHTASAAHHAVPMTPLFGGLPGSINRFLLERGTDVNAQLQGGHMPGPGEVRGGTLEELDPKAFGVPQNVDDVFLLQWAGAGGLGDALDREADAVLRDVRSGMVTADAAERLYGVVIAGDAVDATATERLRAERRSARGDWDRPETAGGKGEIRDGALTFGPGLIHGRVDGKLVTCCSECHTELAPADENWKSGASRHEIPVPEANAHVADPARFLDDEVVVRQFACPGCLRLMDSEIVRKTDPVQWDMRILEEI
ncbi:MAG: hydantoinase B/oxoprolinase family protein [Solirubrobacteraceae bacterium]